MEYLVTLVRTVDEDHQDWTDATGPEDTLERPATGPEDPDHLDLLALLGQGGRKESLDSSLITVSRVYRVCKEETVHLVSEVLMVNLGFLAPGALKDSPARLVLPVLQG